MPPRIIVTVGPSSYQPKILNQLRDSSLVDTYRLNLSHLNFEKLSEQVNHFKKHNIQPALDTQGAQLRVSHNYGDSVEVNINDTVFLSNKGDSEANTETILIPNHPEILGQLNVGDELKIDFNGAVCIVTDVESSRIQLKAIHGGNILQNRAVDVSQKRLKLEPLTDFDKQALQMAEEWGVEEVFLSFANHADDVIQCRSYLPSNIKIISKIESIAELTT